MHKIYKELYRKIYSKEISIYFYFLMKDQVEHTQKIQIFLSRTTCESNKNHVNLNDYLLLVSSGGAILIKASNVSFKNEYF